LAHRRGTARTQGHEADWTSLHLFHESRIPQVLGALGTRKAVVASGDVELANSVHESILVGHASKVGMVVSEHHVDDRACDEHSNGGDNDRNPQRRDRYHGYLLAEIGWANPTWARPSWLSVLDPLLGGLRLRSADPATDLPLAVGLLAPHLIAPDFFNRVSGCLLLRKSPCVPHDGELSRNDHLVDSDLVGRQRPRRGVFGILQLPFVSDIGNPRVPADQIRGPDIEGAFPVLTVRRLDPPREGRANFGFGFPFHGGPCRSP